MTRDRRAVGAYGERCAAAHLTEAGLRVVARNWRCADGEIDIVAWEGEDLVFCEVKTRRTLEFGFPVEAVVGAKARRLRRLAMRWLADHPVRPRDIRFDVVSVMARRRGPWRVHHLRGAF
ncbi:YraN family protein [Actinomycetes bacterium KLBMP 9797]